MPVPCGTGIPACVVLNSFTPSEALQLSLSATVGEGGSMTIAHEGTIIGDEIPLTMKPSGEFPGATVVAKRVKQ